MDLDWFVKEVTELSERLQIAVDKLPQKDEKSKDRKFVPVLHRGQEEKPALESETYSLEEHQSILYKSQNGSAEATPDKESLKSTRAKWTQSSSPVIIAKETQDVKQPNTAFEIPVSSSTFKETHPFVDNTTSKNEAKAKSARDFCSSKNATAYDPC